MKVTEATEYIIGRMRAELPQHLYYHSIDHVNDVMDSARRIAISESVTEYEAQLLITAVAFHDSGFIYQAFNHEDFGCKISREILPRFDYTSEEIENICGMIMATKIPQNPKTLLEEIICDADLDYLGRDDFWTIGSLLYRELKETGVLSTEHEWNTIQYGFLEKHHFFTKSSVASRENKKQFHLKKIVELLKG